MKEFLLFPEFLLMFDQFFLISDKSQVMSLLQMLSGLLDQHGDTAQQAALLAYLKNGEEAQPYLEAVLTARLAGTMYKQFSKEDQYEAARNETVLSIAAWVKEHPRATQVSSRIKIQMNWFKQDYKQASNA